MEKKKNKKASGKPNGNARRGALRAGNRAYNLQRKSKIKGKRVQDGLAGTPRGKHIKDASCQCGGCSTKDTPHSTQWFKGMNEKQMSVAFLGEGYFA